MTSRYAQKKADAEALDKVIMSDSLLALGATFIGGSVLSAIAYRFSPTYRSIPISAKTALILGPSIGAFYIRGEHVGAEYRRNKYLTMLEPEERQEALRRQEAIAVRNTFIEKSSDYITAHRWSILGYTWLAGISGSLYHLMYAQLITLIGILSTAAIASLSDKSGDKHAKHNSAALEAALAGDMKVNDMYSIHPHGSNHHNHQVEQLNQKKAQLSSGAPAVVEDGVSAAAVAAADVKE
ncbi:hypothetical protein BX661DRAFT_184038 [Kickxella alabastrina]|uniref:uncharacterized protein n=1 Tax=Kickxella alabastrina TaxID=61397 RepID=UPI00221FE53B|nr:uncharacterized protein BX661DRAFT_184038 [Kickxella alabastrina]KAI7826443.1 hypothetical protein BX661DRAFT_184038 [Kickxella alabastrina]